VVADEAGGMLRQAGGIGAWLKSSSTLQSPDGPRPSWMTRITASYCWRRTWGHLAFSDLLRTVQMSLGEDKRIRP